jgi:predicted NBD/HSP70 family sugar kinase
MRIGIDLGGTKIACIALDQQGQVLYEMRIDTPQDNYTAIINTIKNCLLVTEAECQQTGSVGISTPGAVSPKTGLLRNSNSTCLNGKNFKHDIENTLKREVRISNDANCFALSEAIDGVGHQVNSVFGVILGTGVGAGIVINQQIVDGPNAISGEWGHNPLPEANAVEASMPCWCGRNACIETFLSGPALQRHYREHHGEHHSAKEVAALAAQGHPSALATMDVYEHRLAKSLAMVINILDPQMIILGGGLSNIQRLYDNIPRLWQDYIFSDCVLTQLRAPMYGDASGVRGAAWLWPST